MVGEFSEMIDIYNRQSQRTKAVLIVTIIVSFAALVLVAKDLSQDMWVKLIMYSYIISWSVSGLVFALLIAAYFYFRWMARGVSYEEDSEGDRGINEEPTYETTAEAEIVDS